MNRADCLRSNSYSVAQEEKPAAVAGLRLIIRTCRHIKETGGFCQAAAVGGRAYCRAHVLLRVRRRRMARALRRAGVLKLLRLTDLRAVRSGIVRVRVALAANHIEPWRARLLLYAMRQMASDIRYMELQKAPNRGGTTAGNHRSAAGDKSNRHCQIAISHSDSIMYEQ